MRAILAVMMLCLAGAAAAQEAEPGRLAVTGEGQVDSVPDMATITLGTTSEAPSAAAALDETSRATAAAMERLEAVGVAARDMQTSDLSLSPIWNRLDSADGRREIVGFEASNTLTVRVRELDQLGAILAEVVESGANTFRGLSFGLKEPATALDEARRRAVADARRKAVLFAEAAGVRLGRLIRLDESSGGSGGPVMMERAFAVAADVPVAQGEVATRAAVSMVYEIEP